MQNAIREIIEGKTALKGAINSDSVYIYFKDADGNALLCAGAAAPSTKAGYAKGCLFIDTATGKLYYNSNTTASCTFNSIADITSAELADSIDLGASGTAGDLDIFPATASKGKLSISATDNAGNTTTALTNAEQAGARTYTIPDAGASANFVMSEGAATINGVKTLGNQLVLQDAHSGLLLGCGASGSAFALGATADNALEFFLDATHTSGDMRGEYMRLYFSGAGGSGEAARIFSTINNVSVATGGTVNGAHISIGTAGANAAVSGAANALRATFGIAALSTNIGGTCAVIQVDTDIATEATVPTNFAFLRFTNTGAKKSNNLMRVPNVAAEAGGLFCAHTTQVLTHSLKIVSEDGTPYYIMCTDASTNRTEA